MSPTATQARTIALVRSLQFVQPGVGAARRAMRRVQPRLPRPAQPDGIRVEYDRALQQFVVAPARAQIQRLLVPHLHDIVRATRRDAVDPITLKLTEAFQAFNTNVRDVNKLVDAARESFTRSLSNQTLRDIPLQFGKQTSRFQRQQLTRQITAALGVNPFATDPHLDQLLDGFVSDNVSLIKTVPQRYFSQVETSVTAALRSGERAESLVTRITGLLDDAYSDSEWNATRIARDQIGKLNGQFNKARQEDLGVTSFFWRTMEDDRVREEHEDIDGNSYTWEDGAPDVGIPGEPIMCRCYADPDFTEILNAL